MFRWEKEKSLLYNTAEDSFRYSKIGFLRYSATNKTSCVNEEPSMLYIKGSLVNILRAMHTARRISHT